MADAVTNHPEEAGPNHPFLRFHRKTLNKVSIVFGYSHIFFAVLNFMLEVIAVKHSELGVTLGTGFVSFVSLAVSGSFTIAIYHFKETRLHRCGRWIYAITAIVIGVCIVLNVAELLNQNKDPNIPRYLQLRNKSVIQLGSHLLCLFVDIFLSIRSHCFYKWIRQHTRDTSQRPVRYDAKSETVSLSPKESRGGSSRQAISAQEGPSGLAVIVEEEPSRQAIIAEAGPSGLAEIVQEESSGQPVGTQERASLQEVFVEVELHAQVFEEAGPSGQADDVQEGPSGLADIVEAGASQQAENVEVESYEQEVFVDAGPSGQADDVQEGPSGLADIEAGASQQAEIVEVESHEHEVSTQAGLSGRTIFVKAGRSGHSDAAEVDRLKKQSASN